MRAPSAPADPINHEGKAASAADLKDTPSPLREDEGKAASAADLKDTPSPLREGEGKAASAVELKDTPSPRPEGEVKAASAAGLKDTPSPQPEGGAKAASAAELKDTPSPPSTSRLINDHRFIRDLDQLRELRTFLSQEAVPVPSTLTFGQLEVLQYNYVPAGSYVSIGRDPTVGKWNQVDNYTQVLFSLLTPVMRRRYLLGKVPSFLTYIPIISAIVALLAFILATISYTGSLHFLWLGKPDGSRGGNVLPFYLLWLMSLGAIGAVAFIGMNALSVQEDVTFDLTNRRFIIMRIALGALFGLVLTLPFGFNAFLEFYKTIVVETSNTEGSSASAITSQAILLVLPFILGFSTSLVILILNRFVDAVQGFFGRRDLPSSATIAAAGGSTTIPTGSAADTAAAGGSTTIPIGGAAGVARQAGRTI